VQRIFKCDKIQDISLTRDKVLNIFIHGTLFCIIIYTSYKLLKRVRFLWPTQYNLTPDMVRDTPAFFMAWLWAKIQQHCSDTIWTKVCYGYI